MLIMEVDRKPVSDKEEFEQAVEKAAENGNVLLLVHDGTYSRLIILKPPKE